MPSDTAVPARQRPEEILAQTLSAPPHPEATDEWSSRGRRIFLIAMAAAGVILVIAGLLVTKELAPGPGHPTPVESGPGNGLANQLLQSSAGDQPPDTAPAAVGGLLPATPTTRPARAGAGPQSAPGAPGTPGAPTQPTGNTTDSTTVTTGPTTTTIPCTGLLGQGIQQAQIPLPCRAPTSSPIGTQSTIR